MPQIKRLDGEDIDKSQRLDAKQRLAENEAALEKLAEANRAKKEFEAKEGKHNPDAWSRENRWDHYVEQQEEKRKRSEERKKNSMFKDYNEMVEEQEKNKGPASVLNAQGNVRQCNQGRYQYSFKDSDDKTQIIFECEVPKFMDTSSLNVDVQPTYVRVVVKDKVTQLHWPDEVLTDGAKVQRSQTTGWLMITCNKANINEI